MIAKPPAMIFMVALWHAAACRFLFLSVYQRRIRKGTRPMMLKSRRECLINAEYVRTLLQEYLPAHSEQEIAFLARRVVTEYEVEVFGRIREISKNQAGRRQS